jgi:hypothetical protein
MDYMKNLYCLATLAAALLVFAACDHAPVGIFASIEQEVKIDDERNLPNGIAVNGIVEFDGYYFVSAPTVYRRPVANTTGGEPSQWTPVASPIAGARNLRMVHLESAGALYAVFVDDAGVTKSLHALDSAGGNWTEVTLPSGATGGLVSVFAAGPAGTDRLFLSVFEGPNDYRLFSSPDGTAFAAVTDSATSTALSMPTPATDVAYTTDGATDNWWIAGRTRFLTGAEPTPATDPLIVSDYGGSTLSDVDGFSGLYFGGPAGSPRLYLSTLTGQVFRYDPNNVAAGFVAAAGTITFSDDPVPLTDFAYVEGSDGFQSVVVGTEGYGYYEIDPATLDISMPARSGNYLASELSRASIHAFYVDTNADLPTGAPSGVDLMFAGTAGLGLWKNYYKGESSLWTRE